MAPLTLFSETNLPTVEGDFRTLIYQDATGAETVVMVKGDVHRVANVPVRIHSACFTSEVMGSMKCDCREQLQFALRYIQANGGAVIYLNQEGRGIGLGNKIAAYALQEKGMDTVDANLALGLPQDARTYEEAADVLKDLGVRSILLMTNNPLKINAMKELGVQVSGRLPVEIDGNHHSTGYLVAKQQRMGHMFTQGFGAHSEAVRRHPFIHLNLALDQHGVAGAGQISCADDWRRVHQLRERYTAIAVGGLTWLKDKPRLTAREDKLGYAPQRQPDRVVFAGHRKITIPEDGRRSFVIGTQETAHAMHVPLRDRDLRDPLQHLFREGVDSMLVEGGRTLHRSFLDQGLVDRLTVFVRTDCEARAMDVVGDLFDGGESPLLERYGKGILITKIFEQAGVATQQSSLQAAS